MKNKSSNTRGSKPDAGRSDALPLGLAALCLVVAGCIPAPGADNSALVLIPYALALVAYAMALASRHRIRLWASRKGAIDPSEAKESQARRLLVAIVAAVASATGEALHVLMNGVSGGFGYAPTVSEQASTQGAIFAVAYFALMLIATACLVKARHICLDE